MFDANSLAPLPVLGDWQNKRVHIVSVMFQFPILVFGLFGKFAITVKNIYLRLMAKLITLRITHTIFPQHALPLRTIRMVGPVNVQVGVLPIRLELLKRSSQMNSIRHAFSI